MTTERTWYTSMNYTAPGDATTVLGLSQGMKWAIKALLMGNAAGTAGPAGAPPAFWTHYASCDSVTQGTDSTDRWGTSFDSTKIVRNSAGVHSWIVLKSPTALGPYYLTLDDSSASGDNFIAFNLSKTAPSGGTTSAVPTATDSYSSWTVQLGDATANPHRMHLVMDAWGNFWMTYGKSGLGRTYGVIGVHTLADTRKSDLAPVLTSHEYNATTTAGSSGAYSLSASLASSTQGAFKGRQISYSTGNYTTVSLPVMNYVGPNGASSVGTTGPLNIGNGLDGSFDLYPLMVANNNSGFYYSRGRLVDMVLASALIPQGACIRGTGGAVERVFTGNVFLPFSVAPVL